MTPPESATIERPAARTGEKATDGPMRVCIVTDAWRPQVNGVVRTLTETRRELEALGHKVFMLTPEFFTTLPCPTYPEIRLSLTLPTRVGRLIDEFNPHALHIATEGPLGWAARWYALRRNMPFTTAYHTRFPEYVQARFGIPLTWTYAIMRRFHAPASHVMVPTDVVKRDLERAGFTNVVMWSRGVDVDIFNPNPAGDNPRDFLKETRPIFLYVGRVAVEKNVEAFLKLDLPGTKWVVGEGPQIPASLLRGRLPAAGARPLLRGGRRVRLPVEDRHVRPGSAGSAGLRPAGRGVSGHRPDRRDRQFGGRRPR
jgi:glycosyltransferase involved in cell wall biosynthesis